MTIEIVEEGDQNRGTVDLATHGRVSWSTGATLRVSGTLVLFAILIRWRDAPAVARMSQSVAFRGYGKDGDLRYYGIRPAAPETDIVTAGGVRFPLSRPTGLLNWSIDAVHHPRRRDPGRAYVTDESYEFAERVGRTIAYYDALSLWFSNDRDISDQQRPSNGRFATLELLARFRTQFWSGEARIGVLEWVCIWDAQVGRISIPRRDPRYASVTYYTGPPADGPTDAEIRRMIGAWQHDDRELPRRSR